MTQLSLYEDNFESLLSALQSLYCQNSEKRLLSWGNPLASVNSDQVQSWFPKELCAWVTLKRMKCKLSRIPLSDVVGFFGVFVLCFFGGLHHYSKPHWTSTPSPLDTALDDSCQQKSRLAWNSSWVVSLSCREAAWAGAVLGDLCCWGMNGTAPDPLCWLWHSLLWCLHRGMHLFPFSSLHTLWTGAVVLPSCIYLTWMEMMLSPSWIRRSLAWHWSCVLIIES